MAKLVITHHAHHPDEEIYKLVYATAEDVEISEGETRTVHYDHQSIVWSAKDPKWQDRSHEDIADEQLQIVRDQLTKQASEREKAEAKALAAKVTHFDTHGQQI